MSLVGLRRASMKAIHSGIAVVASPTLWIVSASSATLPESATTTICRIAVIARIDERPFDRPDAAVGRGDRRIDDAVRVTVRAVMIMPVPWRRARASRSRTSRGCVPMPVLTGTSPVLEFLERSARASGIGRVVEAMLDVIVDQLALGVADGALDRMKLLRKVDTRPALFEHRQDGREMTVRPLEPGDDGRVGCVLHAEYPILLDRI